MTQSPGASDFFNSIHHDWMLILAGMRSHLCIIADTCSHLWIVGDRQGAGCAAGEAGIGSLGSRPMGSRQHKGR